MKALSLSTAGFRRWLLFFPLYFFSFVSLALAQEGAVSEPLQQYAKNVDTAGAGMTLWDVLQSGGTVMIILGILSLIMLSIVIFLFLRLDVKKLVPEDFAHSVIKHLKQKNYDVARKLCSENENIISSIVIAGINRSSQGKTAARESVEVSAKKEVASLWASINYLSDIAQIAPMLGLLGTVLGMIQAFNTIAFEAAVVKPILLAGGVSKAMVTTAGGLSVAIVAVIFYSIFRSKIQNITNVTETYASEVLEAFA